MDPAPDHGCDRRRDAEYHRDGAHQALRFGPFVQIAHDGPPDGHSHAGAHPLHGSERQEPRKARRHCAANRCSGISRKSNEHDGSAAERIGQGPKYQGHDRKRHEVRGERLLHLPDADPKLRLDRRKRRKEGIDRERAYRRKRRQEHSQTAMRAGVLPKTHRTAGRSEASHAAGSALRSSTSTSAEPTMTPST